VGPLVGGWLLDHFWWGSVFLFNVPVAGLALLSPRPSRADPRSQTPSGSARFRAGFGAVPAVIR
ncbi:MFS transporter, partial [Streptomyces seoulensis]